MKGIDLNSTDREWAEAMVAESRERLRLASEAAGVGVYEFDVGSQRVIWSAHLRRLLGDEGDGDVDLSAAIARVHPEDRDRVLANGEEIMRRLGRYEHEFRVVRSCGTVRWMLDRGEALGPIESGRASRLIGTLVDITDRKEAEDRLRQSEERLSAALRAGKLGVYDYDPRTLRIECNPEMYRLWGIPESEQVTYDTFEAGVHPDDLAAVRAAIQLAFDPGGARRYECEYRVVSRPDGAFRWVFADGDVTFDADGPRRMVGIVQDITERKLAEAARREQERRDRYVLRLEKGLRDARTARDAVSLACEAIGRELGAVFAGFGELQSDGEHTVVGNAWAASGDPAPLIGRHCLSDTGVERVAPLFAGETVTVTDVIADPRTADDQAAQAAYSALGVRSSIDAPLMRDGRARAFLFVADAAPRAWTEAEVDLVRETLDRTWQAAERARAEERLRESEERERQRRQELEATLAAIPAAVFIAEGPDCAVMTVNPAGRKLFRLPDVPNISASAGEGLAPRNFDVLQDGRILGPHELPLQRAAATARSVEDTEVELRFVEGDSKVVLGNAVPLFDRSGQVRGAVGSFLDITPRERAEAALRESQAKLESDTAALRRLNEASSRLWRAQALRDGLEEMLGAAIELLAADKGNFQHMDPSRQTLAIVAQRGFEQPFLDYFREVSVEDDSACGRALRSGERIVIEDVEADEGYATMRAVAAEAGYRAVQSTPIVGRDGTPLGMLSTHWTRPHRPSAQDLQRLDLYVRQAADFIERQRGEEGRRRQETELQEAQRLAHIGSWRWDATTDITFGSDELLRIFGFDPATERIPNFLEQRGRCYPVEEWERVNAAVQEAMRTGVGYELDVRALRNGAPIWVTTRSDAVRNASGEIIGLRGTVQDITDRRLAEEKLRQSEVRYRMLHESLRDAFVQVAMDGRIIDCNELYCQMLGYSADEIRTLTYKELTPERWHAFEDGIVRDQIVPRGYSDVYEKEYRRKDGAIFPVELRTILSRDESGRPSSMWGIVRHIGERKRADAELRQSEERLRAIVETAVDAIVVIDERGLIQSVNPALERIFGYAPSEVVGKNVSILMPERDAAIHDKFIGAYLRTGKAKIIGIGREVDHRRKDGSVFAADLAIAEWRQGGKLYFTGTVRDITERKRHEEEVHLLLREVNHRAKNMLGLVQAIARQTAATKPGDFIGRFEERVRALAASQDLLVKNEWKGVDLDELVRSQLAHFKDLIGARIAIEGQSLFISASAAQTIGMALHELATNAGKYGALSTLEGRIEVAWLLKQAESGEENFVITWREQEGPPVAAPSQSGFGTSVIGPMAEMSLDAKIELDHALAGLQWRLECSAAKVIEGSHPIAVMKTPGPVGGFARSTAKPRILVVEDEALMAMEIAHVLTEAGFEVVGPARAVAAALELLKQRGCDAAVLDINLGNETSEPVACELKNRGTPFVTLSGYAKAQHPSIFHGAPALAKPLQPDRLIAKLSACLAR
jgi:PAS domain S-box-containing protein